ncbi:receptor-type tyrosine-protein phosphatase H-like [Lutra lutra]|uniref:receptor-type tyrosine-protein phosphatase H-like n=1 Tax=Lutra lutra TaxID=9657 RepID=UPI001FD546B5|nr:receptor-type tyrosine-protein phosphatase H-like [Lutra lutra]
MKDQTNSSITLNWTEPDGMASQHYLYRIEWEGAGPDGNKSTTNTSVLVDGLQPGSWYQFTVWVELNGIRSSEVTCNGSTVPNVVTSLRMQNRTNSSITLSWTAPMGPDRPSYTYRVSWVMEGIMAINTQETRVSNTSDTRITVEQLEAGSLYTFTVQAERNGVSSDNRTLTEATAPNRVTDLHKETQTNSSITLSWTAPMGPDRPSYTYRVSWVMGGIMAINTQETRVSNTSDTRITVEQLEAGSLYTFTVQAERNGVSSDNRTLTEATAPNRVTDLHKETQTNSSITLSWTAPMGPDRPSYTYRVSWVMGGIMAINTQETRVSNTSDTRITVEQLEAGSLYTFTVQAERNGVSSDNRTLTEATAPNRVTDLHKETQTNSSITLSWTAPMGPDRPSYTYRVSWVMGGIMAINTQETRVSNTSDTRITVEQLEAGSLYTFTVQAERNGVSSDNRTLTEATAPNRVTDLHKETQTNSSITLSWTAPMGPDRPSYTYRVSWVMGGIMAINTQETRVSNTSDTRITVEQLEAGSLYTFTVQAERNGVSSDNRTLTEATAPNRVMDLHKETQTNSSITLSWTAPMGPDRPSYTYRVSWVMGGIMAINTQETRVSNTSDTRITVEQLEAGSLYTFTVQAERNGVSSDNRTLTEATAPNRVTDLHKETQTNSSITLSWTAPMGPDRPSYTYRVSWVMGGIMAINTQETRVSNTSDTRITVEQLEAGSLYTFTVQAERNGVSSDNRTLTEATAPNRVTDLHKETQTNSSITLSWTAPMGPDRPSYTYRVSWVMGGIMAINTQETRVSNTSDTRITVEQLEAGSLYTFTVQAERNGVSSDNRTLTEATAPNRVTDLHKELRPTAPSP